MTPRTVSIQRGTIIKRFIEESGDVIGTTYNCVFFPYHGSYHEEKKVIVIVVKTVSTLYGIKNPLTYLPPCVDFLTEELVECYSIKV